MRDLGKERDWERSEQARSEAPCTASHGLTLQCAPSLALSFLGWTHAPGPLSLGVAVGVLLASGEIIESKVIYFGVTLTYEARITICQDRKSGLQMEWLTGWESQCAGDRGLFF